ncbi:MAG: PP2C family protein-serine/threonine phosphatase, partial [Nitrospinae bacterium]|nr:PP2C family protein-serine/threonine phosphatase [Nitrospinota bacterium]
FNCFYKPCEQVGGDFYDVFRIDEENIGVYICDVSGHGVSAAMITVFIKQVIASLINQKNNVLYSSSETLALLNKFFIEEAFGELFATMSYGVFNEKSSEFTYSSAGHCSTYTVTKDGKVKELEHGGFAIGWFPELTLVAHTLTIDKGSKIIFSTDGIFEAINHKGEIWGEKSFCSCIEKSAHLFAQEFIQKIVEGMEEHIGKEAQNDDIAILTMEVQ